MDGYVAFGRALAAERNAREWQNYARNLETQIRQLKAKLSSTAQDHQLSREVSRRTAELYREEQALTVISTMKAILATQSRTPRRRCLDVANSANRNKSFTR